MPHPEIITVMGVEQKEAWKQGVCATIDYLFHISTIHIV